MTAGSREPGGAAPGERGASSLRFGAPVRLLVVAALVVAVWLGVAWAIGTWD